jgi:hypothetical protein
VYIDCKRHDYPMKNDVTSVQIIRLCFVKFINSGSLVKPEYTLFVNSLIPIKQNNYHKEHIFLFGRVISQTHPYFYLVYEIVYFHRPSICPRNKT